MSLKKRAAKSSIIFIILILALAKNCFAMSLEQYVSAPDDAFEYNLVKTAYSFLYTTYIFKFTSQKWHPAIGHGTPRGRLTANGNTGSG